MITITNKVLKADGFKGLYRGFWPTLVRDVPCWGSYFFFFDFFKNHIFEGKDSVIAKIISGGLCGPISWALTYPTDIVKTHVQTSKENINAVDLIKKLYRK